MVKHGSSKTSGAPPPNAPKADDSERGHVLERPDGYYWQDKADGKVYGPFRTSLDARLDMLNEDAEGEFEEGESLEEAESEIGITGWIDPDTGMPAEETTARYLDE
jgi:hypothetical protein